MRSFTGWGGSTMPTDKRADDAREQRLKELEVLLGSRSEAEFAYALEAGELPGDLIPELPEDADGR